MFKLQLTMSESFLRQKVIYVYTVHIILCTQHINSVTDSSEQSVCEEYKPCRTFWFVISAGSTA